MLVYARTQKAGAITALTFRNLKQITIKESLGATNKHTASRGFLATAATLVFLSCMNAYRGAVSVRRLTTVAA